MYIRQQKFIVETYHQALKPLFEKQLKGAIYKRWIAILQQFNFELRYKHGKEMQVPDYRQSTHVIDLIFIVS
jgi:activator of HSP90 ATPase